MLAATPPRSARARHRPTTLLVPRLPRRESGKGAGSARRDSDWPPLPALLFIGRLDRAGGVRLAGALLVPNSKFLKVPGEGGRALPARGTRRLQRCRIQNKTMKSNLNRSFKMKCDFDCTALHDGFMSVAEKTKLEEPCPLNFGEELCKSCAEEHHKIPSEPYHAAPRNLDPEDERRPVHNKENKHISQRFGDGVYEMEALENSKLNEDSGYSSMLSSQYSDATEQEDSLPLAGNLYSTPEHCLEKNEIREQFFKKTLLPVSHYEEMICSTLKKSGKRNLKSWTASDRIVFRENFELRNLIGKKMGLDRIDILAELLQKNLKHILASILRHLSEMDLINFAKVSTTWKKILQEDKWGFQMYSKALKSLSSGTKTSEHAATREHVLYRAALASVQKATPPNSLSKKGSRSKASKNHSRVVEFSEAAKTLKNTESFKVCHRCGSPAKYDSYLQRAMCNRESCGFDFCTKCMCSYHSSSDCMSGKPVKSSFKLGTLPGTKKSKQNLRRL